MRKNAGGGERFLFLADLASTPSVQALSKNARKPYTIFINKSIYYGTMLRLYLTCAYGIEESEVQIRLPQPRSLMRPVSRADLTSSGPQANCDRHLITANNCLPASLRIHTIGRMPSCSRRSRRTGTSQLRSLEYYESTMVERPDLNSSQAFDLEASGQV